jgi:hypothetical protein
MTRVRRVVLLVVWLLAAGIPGLARAESATDAFPFVDCGEISRSNNSWQFGPNAWLQYIVETSRSINVSPIEVQVEAWVNGVANSGTSNRAYFTASVIRQVPVPGWGNWTTSGKHWFIWTYVTWYQAGSTASTAGVWPPSQPSPADQCAARGGDYYWNGGDCIWTPGSPVIVDMARDGYHLTSVEEGVLFDLNGDGIPDRVAWTQADSDDAFLAIDRNNNGRIDDGSELFGNHTPVYGDRADVTAANGFEVLKFAEGPTWGASYAEGRINSRDAIFSRLLLWRDRNHNGISEPEELTRVADSEVEWIGTDYSTKKRVDRFGNEFRQKAQIGFNDGAVEPIYDIWLAWSR